MRPNRRVELTYKDNQQRGRHSWLRLTPAYSVRIVEQILQDNPSIRRVLEPFAGTGTTGVACAQRGIACDMYDINPFLVWLARVKGAAYSSDVLHATRQAARDVVACAQGLPQESTFWSPPLHQIERWWSPPRLRVLSQLFHAIQITTSSGQQRDLLLLAFCRVMMQWSNAAFNHPSVSFKAAPAQLRLFDETQDMLTHFVDALEHIAQGAEHPLSATITAVEGDARTLSDGLAERYDAVITSPPYANRMSYIRELRPYMYWLGYLTDAPAAGELDWQAIGGTWGVATSRLKAWLPDPNVPLPDALPSLVARISSTSLLLGRYVHKYFADMSTHFAAVVPRLKHGGSVYYVVGNSKFYDTLVPVETLYADLMRLHGLIDITIETLRKRNSKRELFEFVVKARRP